jgi:hypothetical protein
MSVFDRVMGRRLETYLGSEFFLCIRIVMVCAQEEGGEEPVEIILKMGIRIEADCVGKSL